MFATHSPVTKKKPVNFLCSAAYSISNPKLLSFVSMLSWKWSGIWSSVIQLKGSTKTTNYVIQLSQNNNWAQISIAWPHPDLGNGVALVTCHHHTARRTPMNTKAATVVDARRGHRSPRLRATPQAEFRAHPVRIADQKTPANACIPLSQHRASIRNTPAVVGESVVANSRDRH